jgi:hypothetical protein
MTLKRYDLEPDCDAYSLEGFSKLGYNFIHQFAPTFSIYFGPDAGLTTGYAHGYAIEGGLWAVFYMVHRDGLFVGTSDEIDAQLAQRFPKLEPDHQIWFSVDKIEDLPDLPKLNAVLLAHELERT